jgi:glyoxylase I family protein
MSSMYKGIEHTAIASLDPEALASWYEKNLGFPICHRYAGNVFVKAPDGTMLEIIPSEGGPPLEAGYKTPGIRHLAFSVDVFATAVEDLRIKGIEIENFVEAEGNQLAFFRDPEGNICHIIHRAQSI